MRVVIAFAIVYIVWGSTYFFIRLSVQHIPPMMVGVLRYLVAGVLMLAWCLVRREPLFTKGVIGPAFVSGFLLLCGGNGILIWSEQYVPSSLAAVLLASGPIWFVLLDRRQWGVNFRSKSTLLGLFVGFIGVLLLFLERLRGVSGVKGKSTVALLMLIVASISWAAGSLYSKYRSAPVSNSVNAGWQMLLAGLVFVPASGISGEWVSFHFREVPLSSWLAIAYLVTMGSLAGYSAFVWLLQVRPATQVSTHAYVNPVVAVLLGGFFAGESLSPMQLSGLAVILTSVLLINLAKYRGKLLMSK
ncbi:MAG TPA: EamA family transporter [Puia sp.]|uniref:EamA family transporter n=1 Tax=Puia sp. TaxID=2045100 RepID=UPI002BE59E9C|nr:EamA family transporter [Puia sp.]HVU94991.1 EamA family transporter [Puia sp.]